MGADSLPRRIIKKVLAPVLGESTYSLLQTVAMSWDIRSGGWSEPELDLIPLAVRPGETVIDIGANYGLYSYHMGRAVGAGGKVYAFEPVPFTSKTFRRIAKVLRFESVELIDKAVGDKPGSLDLTVPISESGSIIAGTVHAAARNNDRDGKKQHARFEKSKTISCDVVVLDDFLKNVRDVSMIKCDVEGFDYFALKGCTKIIEANHPTIICEINPWFLTGLGLKVEDLVGFFTDRGYRLYRYSSKGGGRGRLVPTEIKDVEEDNWVFVHPSRADRLRSVLPAVA
jgi:FkbM family methyltransferase